MVTLGVIIGVMFGLTFLQPMTKTFMTGFGQDFVEPQWLIHHNGS